MAKLSTTSVFGDLLVDGMIHGNVTGNLTGNASTATSATTASKADILTTARNIALGGMLTGSASFNGSANITINASIAKPPKSGDWFSGGIPIINTDGVMEIGKYIDFHNTDTSTNDYDVRLQANTSTPCVITLPTAAGTLARTSDNVASATKLQTPRTINGTNFDGSANITTANWGTSRTLTIGNKGQSVNGSGNITWSTNDILGNATSLGKDTDWNTANTTGIYEASGFDAEGATGANRPVGAYQWGGLLTLRHKNVTNQIYLSHGSNQMWIRGGWNGSFNTSWARVYTTDYKPTYSDVGAAAASHGTHVTWSTTTPKANGTAAVGSETKVARGDHVHPLQTTVSGNAGSATKWQTARTLTIGNTGKSVDGTANVSWSLSEIGALPLTGGTLTGNVVLNQSSANIEAQYKAVRTDTGTSVWVGVGSGGANHGVYSDKLNKWMVYSDGAGVYLNGSAEKLSVKRTINGTNFDGSANITTANWGTSRKINQISVNGSADVKLPLDYYTCSIGSSNAKPYHHILTTGQCTGNYTDKSITIVLVNHYTSAGLGIAKATLRTNNATDGGTASGELRWLVRSGFAENQLCFNIRNTAKDAYMDVFYKSSGTYNSLTWYVLTEGARGSQNSSTWTKYNTHHDNGTNVYDETGMKAIRTYTATLQSATDHGAVNSAKTAAACSGNAATATKLATARTLTIGNSGKTFDGSGNQSWSLAEIGAAAEGHTHSSVASANVLNSNTKMDYGWNGLNYFNINGTAGNAAKVNDTPTTAWWHIIRCNHANSSGYYTDIAVPFNATSMYYKRITNGAVQNSGWVKMLDALNFNEYAAAKSHGTHVTYATATPSANGTAAVGSSAKVAREDHVHPAQTSVATLTTARTLTIGSSGKSFNGSANVSWSHNEIQVAKTMAMPASTSAVSYVKLITFADAGSGNIHAEAMISGIGDYGGDAHAICLVRVSGRNNRRVEMIKLTPNSNGTIEIGYVRDATNAQTTVYLKRATYDGVGKITILNETGCSFETSLTSTTTAPTGYTAGSNQSMYSTLNPQVNITGNAATSTKLATARNIKIGNATKSFNGTANVEFTLAEIGIGSSISAVASNLSGVTINGYDSMMTTINSNLGNL